MKTGKYWIKIPETIRVIIEGEYTWPTTAKDLALFVLKELHEYGITGKTVEFCGDIIDKLTIEERVTFETFFLNAKLNPNAHLITGLICGYRIEEIETPLTKQVRYLDKLIDELAKGRKMEKILRQT